MCNVKNKPGESTGPLLCLCVLRREGCVEGDFTSYSVEHPFHRFQHSWYLIPSVRAPWYEVSAQFLNSWCIITALLLYWYEGALLLMIYWSNITMLVLFHYYFTIRLLHCHTHTNLYVCFFLPCHSKCKRHNENNACMKYRMQWLIKRSGIYMTWISLKCYPGKYRSCSCIERTFLVPSIKKNGTCHCIKF